MVAAIHVAPATPIHQLLLSAGTAILGAGVFSGVVKSALFSEIYEKALSNVVYGESFLEKRGDLPQVWERVSEALCQRRFPELAPHIHSSILRSYLPQNTPYYLKDFVLHEEVDWDDREAHTIKARTTLSYTVVPYIYGEKVELPFASRKLAGTAKTVEKLLELNVNGVDHSDEFITPYNGDAPPATGQDWVNHHTLTLEGKSEYRYKRVLERTFSILEDPILKQLSKHFILNPEVRVRCIPDDLRVYFESMGTQHDFQPVGGNGKRLAHPSRSGDFDFRYNGIVFPRQGFLLVYSMLKLDGAKGEA